MRHVFLAMALSLLATASWAQGKVPLSTISTYLNGLTTLSAPFTQFNDDGSRSSGTLYVHRPGRMRFEYDGRDAPVVIAGTGAVVIFDPKSNQPPESYPLKRTPLSIILSPRVDLGRANMVVGHESRNGMTVVTAQDPENPEYGRIDLMFGGAPLELREWIVHDDAGGQTRVVLGNMQKGGRLARSLFDTQAGGGGTNSNR
ncbi:outer membrane lipoprotein carrier protein LolA [Sedimentitalea sp. JM2-8]|uniref:Outer membrane lipoprotein carrier protein LolA n=1 Tax=Sedimentitalea xiamensis TaxID=3050037 RepID=A0ABT7F935_9RHOB|nr:outer membrane lipoprotein carrier protein LolA [Sedimentitalea xiamensis]MDK3071568.1 outer membrane lipoprotein carrier protein LolA [Sedimentitalea xiamensis]